MRPFAGIEPSPAFPAPRAMRSAALDEGVATLSRVGGRTAAGLARLGISTIRDLLYHRPRRYELPAPRVAIGDLLVGQDATIEAEVVSASIRRTRRRNLSIVEGHVRDESGSVVAWWFNQEWLAGRLVPGARVLLRGAVERGNFVVRNYDLRGDGGLEAILPVYPASEAIASKRVRELVHRVIGRIADLGDPLPAELRARLRLPLKADAVAVLHTPRSMAEAERARQRLALEELVVLQLGLGSRDGSAGALVAPALAPPGELVSRYRGALPFALTDAQERAILEIDQDLALETPMERLLQGDVGSGKTVVALYALLRAVESGYQGVLMAPTETLAEQHFLTVEQICAELGVACVVLAGGVARKTQRAARRALASGEAAIAVGTHALIQESVEFRSLGVAVIDEQHRFGVEERRALARVGDGHPLEPHRLSMTATPIPRTLALTVWGDLSVTEIDTLPAGRRPIITRWVTHERSSEAYQRLTRHLGDGRQAYIVCPLVSPSEAIEARAAEDEAARLRGQELRDFAVGCLHGQLPTGERRAVMAAFGRGELQVLVATTVIEVGVDVPNATIMIVQEADRFGLAQLHQLRGRVGRGADQSFCLLVSRPKEELTDAACERLQALVDSDDGFALAEVDLELRGEGQLLGTRQTGLSDLRFTRLRSDGDLLEEALEIARSLDVGDGPLADEVARMFGDEDHRGIA